MDLSTDGLVDGMMVEHGSSEGNDENGIDLAAPAGIDRDEGDGMVIDDSSSDGSDGEDDRILTIESSGDLSALLVSGGGSSESLLKPVDGGDKAQTPQTVDLDKADCEKHGCQDGPKGDYFPYYTMEDTAPHMHGSMNKVLAILKKIYHLL
ncbi:hypothetical protein L2E82_14742 [Cichorium intybus]|uniref:Uncharacterized protein n=1 Tax=Cichorium intybus TaxID=13427 RepID=A0ACB9F0I2_CICIN|nr:hypothetical protein L2E82_14742 [Cichorium intybus]